MLLAALQALNIFWFVLIVRILYRFVARVGLADERSDEEDDEEGAEGESGAAREKKRETVQDSRKALLGEGQDNQTATPEVRLNGEAMAASTATGETKEPRSRRRG